MINSKDDKVTTTRLNNNLNSEKRTGISPKVRILIVEVNLINQMLISAILVQEHFEICIVENGKVAIEELSRNDYGIVLIDIMMPEMDGFETSVFIRTKMKEPKKSIPIIAITADVSENIKSKCKMAGFNDYLSNPYKKITTYRHNKSIHRQLRMVNCQKKMK